MIKIGNQSNQKQIKNKILNKIDWMMNLKKLK